MRPGGRSEELTDRAALAGRALGKAVDRIVTTETQQARALNRLASHGVAVSGRGL